MNALIVREPWIDLILAGAKTWELRGSSTQAVGQRIGLIRGGSGTVVGVCNVVDVVGPLGLAELRRNVARHKVPKTELTELPYDRTFAWVLSNARAFTSPVPYRHPRGAVIWVSLSASVVRKMMAS